MPAKGRRHRLLLYTYVLNRLWRSALDIGMVLLILVLAQTRLSTLLPFYTPFPLSEQGIRYLTAVAVFSIAVAIFMLLIRKAAYVQPRHDHLRLSTPFLRMNISYRRFVRTYTSDLRQLFPPEGLKGWKRNFILSLGRQTAVVLELNGWPLPRRQLNMFLSPFFFPDQTPRLALFIPDWIKFTTELDTFRTAWLDSQHHPGKTSKSELLAALTK